MLFHKRMQTFTKFCFINTSFLQLFLIAGSWQENILIHLVCALEQVGNSSFRLAQYKQSGLFWDQAVRNSRFSAGQNHSLTHIDKYITQKQSPLRDHMAQTRWLMISLWPWMSFYILTLAFS